MNVGQNGDPDDCVRFGYLWGLNGGEVGLLAGRYFTEMFNFLAISQNIVGVLYKVKSRAQQSARQNTPLANINSAVSMIKKGHKLSLPLSESLAWTDTAGRKGATHCPAV